MYVSKEAAGRGRNSADTDHSGKLQAALAAGHCAVYSLGSSQAASCRQVGPIVLAWRSRRSVEGCKICSPPPVICIKAKSRARAALRCSGFCLNARAFEAALASTGGDRIRTTGSCMLSLQSLTEAS